MAKYIGKYKGKVGTTHGDLYNGKIGYYEVDIVIPIVSLEITGNNEVNKGNTLQLGISYTPSDTTQTGVVWSSSDETKATVNSNGLVTAIADGSVVITATSAINGSITDSHNINIEIPIVSLEITGDDEVVNGNTLQLGIDYTPSNTTQTGVVWSSSDETKATVDSNGLVTAISGGIVTISATSIVNGAISDSHNINIFIPIVSLEITGNNEVIEGNNLQLGISYNPSNTTQTGVVWSSSDETKATVDSNGLVTTITGGSVVITATSTINEAISDTHNIIITYPEVNITGIGYLEPDIEIYEGKLYQAANHHGYEDSGTTKILYDTNTGLALPWRIMDDDEKIANFGSIGKADIGTSGSALQDTPWRYCLKVGNWVYDVKFNLHYGINVTNGTYRIKILSSLNSSPYGGLLPTLGNILINGSNYLLPNVNISNNTTWGEEQDYVVTDGKLLFKISHNTYKNLGFSGINIKKIA